MGTYKPFATGGGAMGGTMTRTERSRHPPWRFCLIVLAIEAVAAVLTKHGGRIVNGPMPVPAGSWIVHCDDPQRAAFALVAPA